MITVIQFIGWFLIGMFFVDEVFIVLGRSFWRQRRDRCLRFILCQDRLDLRMQRLVTGQKAAQRIEGND